MGRFLPLVINAGQIQQLQPSDTINLLGQVIVNFTTKANSSDFVVTATDVSTSNFVLAWLASRSDTFDNCGDDMDNISVTALANNGNIVFTVTCNDPKQYLYGTFAINYLIG